MPRPLLLVICALLAWAGLPARDSLFGRSATKDTGEAKSPPADDPAKPREAAKRPAVPSSDAANRPRDAAKDEKPAPAEKDEGVRVRPVTMDDGVVTKDRVDFQLSRIDRPLARETGPAFREAWAAFLRQNRPSVDDPGGFVRAPQAPSALKARLLQDLGEGRWLVDAEWTNPGLYAWCPVGANADKALLVLGAGEGQVGAAVEVNALHVALVELRFDCQVPPAAGQRVTTRRHAFVAMPALADDAATRECFQQAVAAGKAVSAVVVQIRDCKACGGLGYVRRAVPGRIQDAHDPCPAGCEKGDQRVPVLVTFKP